MNLTTESNGRAQIVRIADQRIDTSVAIRFKERMRELTQGREGPVILDLSRVDFIDSSGLGAIVAVMKFLAPARQLELAGLTANVGRVFHLTRMDTVFPIHAAVPMSGERSGNVH